MFPGIAATSVAIYRFDPLAGPDAYRLAAGQIEPVAGRAVPIHATGALGFVDRSSLDPSRKRITFGGWAAHDNKPVQKILAFAGGRLVYNGIPNLPRPGVASTSGSGEGLGFEFSVPVRRLPQPTTGVRVYALSDGAAVPLKYWCPPQAQQVAGCPAESGAQG